MAASDVCLEQRYLLTGGGEAFNLLRFVNIGGTFNEETATNIVDQWGEVVQAVCSDQCVAQGDVRFTKGFPEVTDEVYSSTDNHTGTQSGDLYSFGAAFLIRLSAGAGRRKQGRIFIPGVSEAVVGTGGGLEVGTGSELLAEVSEFIIDVATNEGYLLGVGSRLDGVVRGAVGISNGAYIGSQRPRLGRLSYG